MGFYYRRIEELTSLFLAEMTLEKSTLDGDSPVSERKRPLRQAPEYHGIREAL